MREVRDSFLKYLANNLSDDVPVHAIRRDPNDPGAGVLQTNAVNVQFLNLTLSNSVCVQLTSVDIIFDDETKALSALDQIWFLLSSSFYIPQLNYLDPNNPITTHSNVFWDTKGLQFKPVQSDFYYHYSLSLSLKFIPVTYNL